MEPTPIAFAGTVTILGMGVVFFFLALLSLGMVGLRRAYGGDARPAAPAPAEDAATPAGGATPEAVATARHDARWVAAAVAAWLAQQGQFDEVSAAPWDPARRRP